MYILALCLWNRRGARGGPSQVLRFDMELETHVLFKKKMATAEEDGAISKRIWNNNELFFYFFFVVRNVYAKYANATIDK